MTTNLPDGEDNPDHDVRQKGPVEPIDAGDIVERSLKHTESMLQDDTVKLEDAIAGLERIEADLARSWPKHPALTKLRLRIQSYKWTRY